MDRINVLGRVLDNRKAILPYKTVLTGRYVILEPLNAEKHYRSLYENYLDTPHLMDYMKEPPLTTLEDYRQRTINKENNPAYCFYVIIKVESPDDYIGLYALFNFDLEGRKVEAGVLYSSKLQRSIASSEALYLFSNFVFEDLGYIKVTTRSMVQNKKVDSMLKRAGYTFVGLVPDDMMFGEYSVDLNHYAMRDIDWHIVKKAYEEWLHPDNFDAEGKQKKPLRVNLEKLNA